MFSFWPADGAAPIAADLTGANLQGADLRGVDLRFVRGLTAEQLRYATVDESTQLPLNIQRDLALAGRRCSERSP